jgi:putative endonuclease
LFDAWVVESVDTLDLKSSAFTGVRVQVPSRVLTIASTGPVEAFLFFIPMPTFYIIHSKSTDTFYVGSCLDFEMQFDQHRNGHFPKGFKSSAKDWATFFRMDNLEIDTARRIEKHVKKNKSKEYFESLKKDPTLADKLVEEFNTVRTHPDRF